MRYTVQNRVSEAALMSAQHEILKNMYERQNSELGRCVFSQMGTQPYITRLKTYVINDETSYHKIYRTEVDFATLQDISDNELMNLAEEIQAEQFRRHVFHLLPF